MQIDYDYYSILGLTPLATKEEIKKSYHMLIKKYHPDHCPDFSAENITKLLIESYETLIDPNKRRNYDIKFGFDKKTAFGNFTTIHQNESEEDFHQTKSDKGSVNRKRKKIQILYEYKLCQKIRDYYIHFLDYQDSCVIVNDFFKQIMEKNIQPTLGINF